MAAIGYQPPKIAMIGQGKEPDIQPFPFASNTLNAGDIAVLTSNVAAQGATNLNANVLGIVAGHGTGEIFFTGIGGNAAVKDTAKFGAQAMGAIAAGDTTSVHVALAHNNQVFVFSLVQAWATNLLGTTTGILLDATTTFFVADNSQGNAGVLTIIGKVQGPLSVVGGVGDTGALVYCTFVASKLAL